MMIRISEVTAVIMNTRFGLKAPVTPKEFYCEPREKWLKVSMINKVSKEFNLSYTLDYLNNAVYFKEK